MMVPERCPALNAIIAAAVSAAGLPTSRGTGVFTLAFAAWQPEHATAPAGASAADAAPVIIRAAIAATDARVAFMLASPGKNGTAAFATPPFPFAYAIAMEWFFSGNERIRLPVARKYAFITAGAATQIVGSPMPPHGPLPPLGMMIDSTFGIVAIRMES
jgi:hypothetical protein